MRLLVLAGICAGLHLVSAMLTQSVTEDSFSQFAHNSPLMSAVVWMVHTLASGADWALIGVVAYLLVRWTLGAPLASLWRS